MITDMQTARLVPTHQLLELPRAVWHGIRRLARREPRWYLTADDNVIARFTSEKDHDLFLQWLKDTHIDTYDTGHKHGQEVASALHGFLEDKAAAGTAGT